jgi:hypothetical protein
MDPPIAERVRQIWEEFDFRGALAPLNLRVHVHGHGFVTINVSCDVPSSEVPAGGDQAPISVSIGSTLDVDLAPVTDAILRSLLSDLVRRLWDHELTEGLRLKDGTFVLGDPHPKFAVTLRNAEGDAIEHTRSTLRIRDGDGTVLAEMTVPPDFFDKPPRGKP